MCELVEVVWGWLVRGFWSNKLTTIPIAVSVVSIFISLATAMRQNKIALFELRYRCFSQLRTIRSFDASVHDCEKASLILTLFDALWGTNIASATDDERLVQARCQLEKIIHAVGQGRFLFKHKFCADLFDIMTNLQKILIAATQGNVDVEAQKNLHQLCERFEEKDLRKIRGEMRL